MVATFVVNNLVGRDVVYIGRRAHGMHFGNPFGRRGTLARVHVRTRQEAIARYESWLRGTSDIELEPERRAWILAQIPALRGKRLSCFCFPRTCHGDVLVRLVAEVP